MHSYFRAGNLSKINKAGVLSLLILLFGVIQSKTPHMECKNKEKSKIIKGADVKKKKRLSIDSKLKILKKFKINNPVSHQKKLLRMPAFCTLHFVHVTESQCPSILNFL